MARRNVQEQGTQTGPSVQHIERCIMIDKATQTGPPTRDVATQTEWIKDAGTQTDPETPPRASLMGLPTEIRQQVFEQALTVDREYHQTRLRGWQELSMVRTMLNEYRELYENMPSGPSADAIHYADNSLLRVNRKISEEAIELFYRVNKFHYAVYFTLPKVRWNWCPLAYQLPFDDPCHPHLDWMTDLSISFIGCSQHSDNGQIIDEDIAGHVRLISKTCSKLKRFTLHFMWEGGRKCITDALRGQSLTAEALAAMSVRDRLSIIATAPLGPVGHLEFADVRNAVAPESCWNSTVLDDWPEISMQGQYYEGYRNSTA